MRPDHPADRAPIIIAARRRHELTLAKAIQAIRELDRAGTPVTFTALAQAAGVSRSWLYQQADLRAQIQRLREATTRSATAPHPSQCTSDASLLRRMEALHAEHQRVLDERAQLARVLGELREARQSRDPANTSRRPDPPPEEPSNHHPIMIRLVPAAAADPAAAVSKTPSSTRPPRSQPYPPTQLKIIFWAASWFYDGSAPGPAKTGYGNNWVIAAIVVKLPAVRRPVAIPVLAKLVIKNTNSASRLWLARRMTGLLAGALPGRDIHVVADSAYAGRELKKLPAAVTWATRLRKDAALYGLPPARTGKRGRPRQKGDRLSALAKIAATTAFTQVSVTQAGVPDTGVRDPTVNVPSAIPATTARQRATFASALSLSDTLGAAARLSMCSRSE